MKLTQTFWAEPSLRNPHNDEFGRFAGGWLSEEQHAMSWALSCLKFNEFYHKTELHTDRYGEDWLINKLNLPYSNVVRSLDNFHYPPTLWALPKINTYSLQNEPFIHADGDVYIWKRLSSKLWQGDFFVQNVEFETTRDKMKIYEGAATKIQQTLKNCPMIITQALNRFAKTGRFEAYNMGIFGASDISFLKYYCNYVFNFISSNENLELEGKDMNFIEQFFFYGLCLQHRKITRTVFDPENAVSDKSYSSVTKFHVTPIFNKYIHLLANSKRNVILSGQVPMRLKYEFPKIYNHIVKHYKSHRSYPIDGQKINHLQVEECFKWTIKILTKVNSVTPHLTYKTIKSRVEKLYRSNENLITNQFLYDIFKIETVIYKSKDQPAEARSTKKGILDLLYRGSIKEILNQKFIFDNDNAEFVFRHFEIPSFPLNEADKYLDNDKLGNVERLPKLQVGILSIDPDNRINFTELTGINVALAYFEESPLDPSTLVMKLKELSVRESSFEQGLQERAIEFIFNFSLYFNYLKLYK